MRALNPSEIEAVRTLVVHRTDGDIAVVLRADMSNGDYLALREQMSLHGIRARRGPGSFEVTLEVLL